MIDKVFFLNILIKRCNFFIGDPVNTVGVLFVNLSLMRKKINKLQKPLFYVNLLPRVMEEPECFDVLREKGIPVFTNPRRAAKALRLLVNYNDYLRETS